jgi:hypothetical protein
VTRKSQASQLYWSTIESKGFHLECKWLFVQVGPSCSATPPLTSRLIMHFNFAGAAAQELVWVCQRHEHDALLQVTFAAVTACNTLYVTRWQLRAAGVRGLFLPALRFCNTMSMYVGDALLSLVVAQHGLQAHPHAEEGQLSIIRSQTVNNKSLHRASVRLGLHTCILSSPPLADMVRSSRRLLCCTPRHRRVAGGGGSHCHR